MMGFFRQSCIWVFRNAHAQKMWVCIVCVCNTSMHEGLRWEFENMGFLHAPYHMGTLMGGSICHYCPFRHSFVGRTKPKFYQPKQTIDLAPHFFRDLEVGLSNGLGQRYWKDGIKCVSRFSIWNTWVLIYLKLLIQSLTMNLEGEATRESHICNFKVSINPI